MRCCCSGSVARKVGSKPAKRRKHIAWGASPRMRIKLNLRAHEVGGRSLGRKSLNFHVDSVARIRGLENLLCSTPGACAPGFMLAPASRAKTTLLFKAARWLSYLTILGINTTINARSLIVAVPTTTFSPSRRLRAVCTRPRIPSPESVNVKSCI